MAKPAAPHLRILPPPAPRPRAGRVLPLREAVPGSEVRLIALRLEYRDRDHLYRMGLMENQCVRIVHNDHRGRVMLRLGQDIFLLGRRETPRIQVREIVLD